MSGKPSRLLLFAGVCLAARFRPHATPAATVVARQDAVPTLTLGPREVYTQSPTAVASPVGTQLRILPSDIAEGQVPEGGLDFFFGDDLIASLGTTLEESCGAGASEQCVGNVVQALNRGRSSEIEARVLGIDDLLFLGIGALVVTVAGIVVEAWRLSGEAPEVVHMPSSDVVQVQSQTDTVMPILTSSGGAVITVPATLPSTTTDTGPTTASVYTLTTDDGLGHSSGVPVAAIPSQAANLLAQLFARSGECPRTAERKRQNVQYEPVGAAAAFVMRNAAAPGELLNALGFTASSRLPDIVDEAAQASWETLRGLADTLPDFENVDGALRDTITSGVWQGAYRYCADALNDFAESPYLLYFEQSLWGEDNQGGDDDPEDPLCPAEAPTGIDALRCNDPQCSGFEGLCRTPEFNQCACLPSTTFNVFEGSLDVLESQQYVLQALLAEGGSECSDEDVTLERKHFDAFVELWCSDIDLSSDTSKSLTADDIEASGYVGMTFKFAWEDKESACSATCQEIFHSFGDVSECVYNSHTFAKSGSQDLTCGKAIFEISVPNPDAPYVEGRCSIDVHLDAWDGETDDASPFWLHIDRMRDTAGVSLTPTDEWIKSGAAHPMKSASLLEDLLLMRPILAPDSSIPYIHFDLGAQSWPSTDRLDSGAYPGCNTVPSLLDENPQPFYYYCEFVCIWGGGATSIDKVLDGSISA